MRTSASVQELMTALAAADFGTIHKEGWNEHLGTRFVQLRDVVTACESALLRQGLLVIQGCQVVEDRWSLTTRLQHTSGEWIETDYPLHPDEGKGRSDAMAVGSAVSYARRHALMALLCLAAEDDDGQGGRRPQQQQRPQGQQGQWQQQAPQQQRPQGQGSQGQGQQQAPQGQQQAPQQRDERPAEGQPSGQAKPGMVALRKAASGMPGGVEAFEAFAKVHAKKTAAVWAESLADIDRQRVAEALQRRLAGVDNFLPALRALALKHPTAWHNALATLGRAGALAVDLPESAVVAIYLHLQSLEEDADKRREAKNQTQNQGGNSRG